MTSKMPKELYAGRGRENRIICFEADYSDETHYTRTDTLPSPADLLAVKEVLEGVGICVNIEAVHDAIDKAIAIIERMINKEGK